MNEFFRVVEMTFSHVTAVFVNVPFDKECRILVEICICVKNTLYRS